MMSPVPLSPRRLPRKFNRSVTSHTRKLVRARHDRRRQYSRERWSRMYQRLKRQVSSWRRLLWRFLLVLGIGLMGLAIWLILFSPVFAVTEIRVRRTERRLDEESVHVALRPLVNRHLLYLSDGEVRPLLTTPLERINRAAVPDLRAVSVSKDYPSSLIVSVELDPIIARLAIQDPGASEATKEGSGSSLADYLTDEGMYVAYLSSQVASGATLPLIRIVDWTARPAPWTTVLGPTFLQTMRKAEQSLSEQFGQPVRERSAFMRAQEFHLRLATYELWFDFKSPLDEQLQRYRLFLQSGNAGNAKEYVDLRLQDRIIYK